MFKVVLDLIKKNKKRSITHIIFSGILAMSIFCYITFKNEKSLYISTNIKEYLFIISDFFFYLTILSIISFIFLFKNRKKEKMFHESVFSLSITLKNKYELIGLTDFILSIFGIISGISIGLIIYTIFYIFNIKTGYKYNINFINVILSLFIPLFLYLSYYLMKIIIIKNKEKFKKINYINMILSITAIILFMFISIHEIFFSLFFIILLILISTISYNSLNLIVDGVKKKNSQNKIFKKFLSKKVNISFYFLIFLLFINISYLKTSYNLYKSNNQYYNFEYSLETENLNETLQYFILNQNYSYDVLNYKGDYLFEDNNIKIIKCDLYKLESFFDVKYIKVMPNMVENPIVLNKEYLGKYNLGDSVSLLSKDGFETFIIYGFIENSLEETFYTNNDLIINSGTIIIKEINKNQNNIVEIYNNVSIKPIKTYLFFSSYNFKYLLNFILSIIINILSMIFIGAYLFNERTRKLLKNSNEISSLRESQVRDKEIRKYVVVSYLFSFISSFIFSIMFVGIFIFYKNKYYRNIKIPFINNFTFLEYIIDIVEIFIIFIIIILIVNVYFKLEKGDLRDEKEED